MNGNSLTQRQLASIRAAPPNRRAAMRQSFQNQNRAISPIVTYPVSNRAARRNRNNFTNVNNTMNRMMPNVQFIPRRFNTPTIVNPARGGPLSQTAMMQTITAPVSNSATLENSATNRIRVTRTEYAFGVTTADANGLFTAQQLNLTPAIFGWLRNLGALFTRYRFNALAYRFVPMVSSNTAGLYYTGFQADHGNDNIPATLQEAQGLEKFHSGSVWHTPSHFTPVNPQYFDREFVLRIDAKPESDADPVDFINTTPGRLWFGTVGVNAVGTVGQIEVYMDVTFSGPQIPLTFSPGGVVDTSSNDSDFQKV